MKGDNSVWLNASGFDLEELSLLDFGRTNQRRGESWTEVTLCLFLEFGPIRCGGPTGRGTVLPALGPTVLRSYF